MSHLLAIAVGPVQELIAAARRTRDLWFGSYLLSEISRAVAKSVEADGGKLIFPESADAKNIANVILAELPEGDPKDVATKAKQAAQKRWLEFAGEAFREASGVIRQDIWDDQVEDVIEFYAAWVQCSGDYTADRRTLMRLLGGRKNCRDFLPAKGRAGVPKSSLDGQRESVLKDPARERWPERFRARLRIRAGEQLDVLGVVKRVAGGTQLYPSVSRIAADPWVRGNEPYLDPIRRACEQLGNSIIRRLNTDDARGYPHLAAFPYEGAALFVSRHHELIEETEITLEELRPLRDALAKLPQPEPYLAVMVADGDRIGAAISSLPSPDENREFSRTLAAFADAACTIVHNHNGVLVYAGGDDVLAFLPLDKCLHCARALHDDFEERLAKYGKPTLSVGIAIGHFMENLEDLLNYGREAERMAKRPDRDGLAVRLHKRGGAPIGIRARWSDDPDRRLERFAELMNQGIVPTRLPYELRSMANLYEQWKGDADAAIQQDLYRVIAKKTSRGLSAVRQALSADIQGMNSAKLTVLANEMLFARQIAVALRQAKGQSVAAEEVTA